jgi:annexin A7/11
LPEGGYPPSSTTSQTPTTSAYAGSTYTPQRSPYPLAGAGGYPPPQGSVAYSPSSGYPPPQGSVAYPPPGGYPPPQGSAAYPPPAGYPPPQGSVAYPPPAGYTPPQGSVAYPPPAGYPPYGSAYPPQGSYANYATGAYDQTNTFGLGGTTQLLTPDEVSKACKKLRDAMKGLGTDEDALISVLGKYPPIQMNQISIGYKSNYGKSLESAVDSETSGNFGKLCIALSKSILDFDVYCLHDAIAGLGTDEDCLIEILVGRTNADIQAICKAYKEKYRNSLENDIKGDTSGYFRRLLVALIQGNRDESNKQYDVKADVEALYKAGEGRMGTDENVFISILCGRPDVHLRQVFAQYQKKYGHSMEKAIKNEFSGDIKKALINFVKSITNRNEYIAEQFENSMKGLGTKDNKLIRLTVRYRDPSIIKPIKAAYQTMYGKSLKKRIEGDTSGDYRKLLLTCIGEK